MAAKRARKLANGAEATVDWENDKPTVVALREIAAGHIGPEISRRSRASAARNDAGTRCGHVRRPARTASRPGRLTVHPHRPASALSHGLRVFHPRSAADRKTLDRGQPAAQQARDLPAAGAGRPDPRCLRVRRRGPRGPEAPVRRALHHAPGRGRRHPRRPAPGRADDHRGAPARRDRGHADARRTRSRERFGADVAELVDGVSKLDQHPIHAAAPKRRPRASARCCSRWRATSASSWSSSPTARTTCARSASMPPAKRRASRARRSTSTRRSPTASASTRSSSSSRTSASSTLYPVRYRVLERALKRARGNQQQFVGKIADNAAQRARRRPACNGRGRGREKHLYSIYQKMRRKRSPLAEIVDVFGVPHRRRLASTPATARSASCTACIKPMPGRFKDYIAIPRVNGYQSLHTTLFGPNGMPLEVQIRTDDMHRVAERASPRTGSTRPASEQATTHRRRARASGCSSLMEMHARRQLRRVPRERQGRPVPRQGLRVHAEGRDHARCRAARPRSTSPTPCTPTSAIAAWPPRSIAGSCRCARGCATARRSRSSPRRARTPNPAWVNFVVDREGARRDPPLPEGPEARRSRRARQAAAEPGAADLSAGAEESAGGAAADASRRARPEERRTSCSSRSASASAWRRWSRAGCCRTMRSERRTTEPRTAQPLAIAGTEGMVVSYARCCFPIPDDPIMAFMSSGRGVVIHREACGNLARLPQAAGQVDPGHLAAERRAAVQRRSAHRRGQPHGRARGDRLEHRRPRETNIEHVRVDERDGDASTLIVRPAGARPQAPGARRQAPAQDARVLRVTRGASA